MDEKLLKKLMFMTKVELDAGSQATMLQDLAKICDWIEQLQTLETENVAPLTTLSLEQPILREDVSGLLLNHEKALSNAPYSDSNYFTVPNLK